jgi:hypothetical protein
MANVAAYTGLLLGELAALTIAQVNQAARVITVDRKVIEVAGQQYVGAPKNRKHRKTIYPRLDLSGGPVRVLLFFSAAVRIAHQHRDGPGLTAVREL